MTYKYFNVKNDPLIVGGTTELISMLDTARGKSGIPYALTCVLRTAAENAAQKDSVKDSAHLANADGLSEAADMLCTNYVQLLLVLGGLLFAGFRRVGIYVKFDNGSKTRLIPTHLHVDVDKTKPMAIWVTIEQ